MKKTYALNTEGKNRDRLLDAAKHDIRKYVKRERARALPAGVDFWDFDCKLGANEASAGALHFASLITSVDALIKDGGDQFYVEVVTKHGHRTSRPAAEKPELEADFEESPARRALFIWAVGGLMAARNLFFAVWRDFNINNYRETYIFKPRTSNSGP